MSDKSPVDRFEQWESALLEGATNARRENRELVEHVEREIVGDHDGGVNHVPAVIARETLEIFADDLEGVSASAFDKDDARRLVAARSLANCVDDDWNPGYNE